MPSPTKKSSKTTNDEPSNRELAELVLGLRAELAELKRSQTPPAPARLAKGTAPQVKSEPATVEEKIKAALIPQPLSIEELATTLSISLSTIENAIGKLEQSGIVAPTTNGRGQRYAWRPDPSMSTEDRRKIVVGLLMEHPKGQSDLLDILRMDAKQLEYDIIEIRRHEPVWHMNKGTSGRGRSNIYWIRPDRLDPPPELDGRIARTSRKKPGETK